MKKEVSEVLKKEQNNESCIHLYLEECGWGAYEVSAYLLMNLLGGKCIVEKIEQCGSKIVRALMNIDLLGDINYGDYRYAGLNSYNLQLVGKNKVDKKSNHRTICDSRFIFGFTVFCSFAESRDRTEIPAGLF